MDEFHSAAMSATGRNDRADSSCPESPVTNKLATGIAWQAGKGHHRKLSSDAAATQLSAEKMADVAPRTREALRAFKRIRDVTDIHLTANVGGVEFTTRTRCLELHMTIRFLGTVR